MATSFEPTFGAWLRRRRRERGLTPEQLAARLGCAVETIRVLEADTRRPSQLLAAQLAGVLELPAGAHSGTVPGPPGEHTRHALPTIPSALIGRDEECASILGWLRARDQRLITLLGPGGIGKTSLALQVAAQASGGQRPLAAAFVALTPVATASDVPLAILEALGAAHGSGPAIDQVVQVMQGEQLLVLDNVEHLLGPGDGHALAGLIRQLLDSCAGLRLLVTSRARLHLQGERVVELAGLATPASVRGAQVERSSAVRLFVERAQRIAPGFALTPANRAAVAQICRQLGGTPLAIEMAAAWLRALSPAEIAAEIGRSLDFLVSQGRDIPGRHRSMRAVLDHSWQLLSEAEQGALLRLSVFQGGCDRAAAEQVAQAGLPALTALIDTSLVRREPLREATRYSLHELVRQYAAERLAADARAAAELGARHTAFYAALLQRAIPGQPGAAPESRLQLQHDLGNLRAAWARASASGDVAALAAMTRGMWVLYSDHGWLLEGAALFGAAAEGLAESSPALRGLLLGLQGHFLNHAGQYEQGRRLLEHGLALLEDGGTRADRASLTYYLATSELQRGQIAAASALFGQASELAGASGDQFLRLWADYYLAMVTALGGGYALAAERAGRLAGEWAALGYLHGEAICLVMQGEALRLSGNAEQAATHIRRSLALGWQGRVGLIVGLALAQLGALAYDSGELEEARYLACEGVETLRPIGDPWPYGRALALLGRIELERGQAGAAERMCAELVGLVAAGEALLAADTAYLIALLLQQQGQLEEALALASAASGFPGEHPTLQRIAELEVQLRQRLGASAPQENAPDRSLAAWLARVGQRSHAGQPPVADAPPDAPPDAPIVPRGSLYVPETGEILSAREIEVLRLLIAGHANPEIAERLVISRHTAKHHVASILQKLGASSRTQAALKGRALGLAPATQ
jgi:predicted ATPase/DNA-binding CsgD family transcriptional regulator